MVKPRLKSGEIVSDAYRCWCKHKGEKNKCKGTNIEENTQNAKKTTAQAVDHVCCYVFSRIHGLARASMSR